VRDRGVRIERIGLRQHSDGGSPTSDYATAVRFDRASQKRQERGFPVAISADDPDAVALIDAEGNRVEDLRSRVLKANVLASKQVRHSANLNRLGV